MTLFNLIDVDYNDIDLCDTYYQLSDDANVNEIAKSIDVYGLLNPPLLRKIGDRFIVLSGFKRIKACILAGITIIPAMVTECEDNTICAKIAIMENSYKRELSIIERVRCVILLKKSRGAILKDETFYKNTCEALNIPYAKKYIDMLDSVANLPLTTLQLINDDFLSLTVAADLFRFDSESIVFIEKIFNEFKASVSKQKELITLINEISRICHVKHSLVLNELYQYIMNVKTINPDRNYVLKSARVFLFKKRYPNISVVQENYHELVSRLKFPEGVRFIPPENFEGQNYQLCLSFNRLDGLKTLIRQVEKLSLQKEMEMIMNREYQ